MDYYRPERYSETSRLCTKCKIVRPIEDFYLTGKERHQNRQKVCKWCLRNMGYKSLNGHAPPPPRDPIKKIACQRVRDAVKDGKLVKPTHCEGCREQFPAHSLDGHHWKGYDNPLDVRWLCRMCHKKEEREVA